MIHFAQQELKRVKICDMLQIKQNTKGGKMYSKIIAVLLNSVFGVCLSYTAIALWFMLKSNFVTEGKFVVEFTVYNIVWLGLDIAYNITRYQKQGDGLFFWMSIILPHVLIILILMGVIIIFF